MPETAATAATPTTAPPTAPAPEVLRGSGPAGSAPAAVRAAPPVASPPAAARPAARVRPRLRPAGAEHGGDRLALAVASATLGLRGDDRGALGRRMRLTASAVLLFAAGVERPAPDGGELRRTAALNALKRLALQVALAERLGYLDPPTALALLEEQMAVRLALTVSGTPN